MIELITIAQVAKLKGWSYHVARNHLNRTQHPEEYKYKLGHTVVYDRRILELLK